ncbi:MAG: ROK family protein [Deltaproteobacteria bacterium]|nr:ROK family protein [Deltaproteobacteria bacterium]
MKKYYLGIDIGGTNLRFGVVDKKGIVMDEDFKSFHEFVNAVSVQRPIEPAPPAPPQKQVEFITKNLKCFLKKNIKYNISGIGVGIAGQINKKTGDVLFSPNLNWRNVPLRAILERETGLRVKVVNDLAAITYGEWKWGAGTGGNNIVCIFVGTGIGSGVVIDGKLLPGCSNTAGEIGHIVVVSGGRKCTCGNNGCLEAYAGGRGIAEIAKEMALKDRAGFMKIIEMAGGIENISAETIAGSYYLGDLSAIKLVKKIGIYLSDGVITVVNLINPCTVILGGGVIDGIPDLFNIVAEEVGKRALRASTSHFKILMPMLGKSSGIIGAAGMAALSASTYA